MSDFPQNISNGIRTNLSAASAFNSQIGDDFKILERVSACCLVIGMTKINDISGGFGGRFDKEGETLLMGYVKDTGQSASGRLYQIQGFIKNVRASLESDWTLQGNVDNLIGIETDFNLEQGLDVNGHLWHPVEFTIKTINY